ncbi:MAG TPA: TIM-barrel domain-containing protein [Opitutaceae bacterium]|jgi:alpha-D-xyloside xylohydrolase
MKLPAYVFALALLSAPLLGATPVRVLPDGVLVDLGDTSLKLTPYAPDIVRVTVSPAPDASVRPSLDALPCHGHVTWSWNVSGDVGSLLTSKLDVRLNLHTGRVQYFDVHGHELLGETEGTRRLIPAVVQGENTFHVRERFNSKAGESFYGLGEYQYGWVDIKGHDLDLWQHNTTIAIPLLLSNRGYGVLWDNASFTRWGSLAPWTAIPAGQLIDDDGKAGGLTASYSAGRTHDHVVSVRQDADINIRIPDSNHGENRGVNAALPKGEAHLRWTGFVDARTAGGYEFKTYADGEVKLWIDGRLLVDRYRQNWLAEEDRVTVRLPIGRHAIKMEWLREPDDTSCQLRWKAPAEDTGATSLWSEVGDGVDYYFIYGPSIAQVIAGDRQITGPAPMIPQWAFGLWQSRERYKTAQESLDVIDEFRRRHIPFDNIVQDWQYWKLDAWGSHDFDSSRFPDPKAWVQGIHDRHAHAMISVWAKFYDSTANFKELQSHGFLFNPPASLHTPDFLGFPNLFLDVFNPAARRMFWDQMDAKIYTTGVDAWWMDASEPDPLSRPLLDQLREYENPNYLGSGARHLLAYPLMEAEAVYDGQRSVDPDRRFFNLTRSGFLGLQRYGAASWSGDTTSDWRAMKTQIAAGLGYSISGLPYWTMDSGGFSVPPRFEPDNLNPENRAEWNELNSRWFEFAAFGPLLRVHGQTPFREMWQFGDAGSPAYDAMLESDRLRYRLFPYIYSLAGDVAQEGGVILRPLVMDFPNDAVARELSDQFLFGPSFLVNPVTEYRARSRSVYLPLCEGGWYDFWTGRTHGSDQTVTIDAPYDHIPILVRAGSIVPVGPDVQYIGEKPADPLTVWIYAGANGYFSLYEDDGTSYGCERGQYSRIPLQWNDGRNELAIGGRAGRFPGMLENRKFRVIVVSVDHPRPFDADAVAATEVMYRGLPISVKIP